MLQSNAMIGGVIVHPSTISEVKDGKLTVNLQDATEGTNNFGLGLFGFIVQDDANTDNEFILVGAQAKDGVVMVTLQPITMETTTEDKAETPAIKNSGEEKTLPLKEGIKVKVPDPLDYAKSMEIDGTELLKYISENARKVENSLLVTATEENGEITKLEYIQTP